MNPFPQEIALGLLDLLVCVADNESRLIAETDTDTDWLDSISGLYATRWGVNLFQRMGNRMVIAAPDALRPSTVMGLGEQKGTTFRWVTGPQNGPFGESHRVIEARGEVQWHRGASIAYPFSTDYLFCPCRAVRFVKVHCRSDQNLYSKSIGKPKYSLQDRRPGFAHTKQRYLLMTPAAIVYVIG